MKNLINDRKIIFLSGAVIGAAIFLIIFGWQAVIPTNDAWIMYGYDEWDINQHYAGWTAFRESTWSFPLGQADAVAYPSEGVNIAFTDSIPLAAVFFKILSPILPRVFQYEGLCNLFAYVMFGGGAALLVSLFLDNYLKIVTSTAMFTLSPIMMERAFRHTSLASHYLIIFAMYFYFLGRREKRYHTVAYALLMIMASGITPYFMPMIAVFIFLHALDLGKTQGPLKSIGFTVITCGSGIVTAILLGSILNGYSASREGYGEYSLNLNSIFNPSSLGGYAWSVFLPKRPQLFWQFDGFNYLGAGVLTGLMLVCTLCLVMILVSGGFRKELSGFLKRNGLYAVSMLLLTLFAISNVICFDDIQIAQFQLPDTLMHLFGIFRASSRMFYPVSYTILLSIVVGSDRILKYNDKIEKYIPVILCILLVLQAVDLSKVIIEKHNKFKGLSGWGDPFVSELNDRMDDYELMFLPIEEMGGIRNLIIEASKHGLKTNGFDANTGTSAWDTTFVWTAEVEQAANNGILNEDYIYATHDESRYEMWENLYRDKADFIVWNTKESGCFDINEKWIFMLPKKSY